MNLQGDIFGRPEVMEEYAQPEERAVEVMHFGSIDELLDYLEMVKIKGIENGGKDPA